MALRMKRGETILWNAEDDIGDLTGVTITASIGRADFHQVLTVTADDLTVGKYIITGPDTKNFPIGPMSCDIKYVVDGTTDLSNTFRVIVESGITK